MSTLDPEDLRRLLAEAVEPVEPAPTSYARLQAKVRARERRRPFAVASFGHPRWALAGAGLLGAAAVAGVVVVGGVAGDGGGGDDAVVDALGVPPSLSAVPPAGELASPPAAGVFEAPGAPAAGQDGRLPGEVPLAGPPATAGLPPDSGAPPEVDARAPDRLVEPADMDGDAVPDGIRFEGSTVVADLSAAGPQRLDIEVTTPDPRVLGYVDIDGDAYSEVLIRTGQGASTGFDGILRLVEGQISIMTIDAVQAQLGVGGTVTHLDGFSCSGGRLLVTSWTLNPDGVTGTGTTTTYVLQGAALRVESQTSAEVPPEESGPYGDASCGQVAG